MNSYVTPKSQKVIEEILYYKFKIIIRTHIVKVILCGIFFDINNYNDLATLIG